MGLKKALLIGLFFLMERSVYAQCAMCKAVAETDLANGGTAAKGINNGILYLMAFPYILLAVVGYFIYKHFNKKDK